MKEYEKKTAECYSEWGKIYFDEYYGKDAPYPPVHVPLVIDLIRKSNSKNILDAGCGPASFLRYLFKEEKLSIYGFDLTKEMVDEGKRVLKTAGLSEERIWLGSVLDKDSYLDPVSKLNQFDSIVCSGVLPHISEQDEDQVLKNSYSALVDGGTFILEARNQFFSLFTLNRYSYEFFLKELIQIDLLKKQFSGEKLETFNLVIEQMKNHFNLNLPPIRKGYAGEPGYDEILSRTHNPFVMKDKLMSYGFKDISFKFYHYHPLPPIFKDLMPDIFTEQAVKMENPDDWRGLFMASAFFLVAKK
jgi:2-polyprenyl-3-methyl-5-hydroxy-6-metoxy-1,4-benzoquinol methylase